MRPSRSYAAMQAGGSGTAEARPEVAALEVKLLDVAKLVRTAQECQQQSDILRGLQEQHLTDSLQALQQQVRQLHAAVFGCRPPASSAAGTGGTAAAPPLPPLSAATASGPAPPPRSASSSHAASLSGISAANISTNSTSANSSRAGSGAGDRDRGAGQQQGSAAEGEQDGPPGAPLVAERKELRALVTRVEALEAALARATAEARKAEDAREQAEMLILERLLALEAGVADSRAEAASCRCAGQRLTELEERLRSALGWLGGGWTREDEAVEPEAVGERQPGRQGEGDGQLARRPAGRQADEWAESEAKEAEELRADEEAAPQAKEEDPCACLAAKAAASGRYGGEAGCERAGAMRQPEAEVKATGRAPTEAAEAAEAAAARAAADAGCWPPGPGPGGDAGPQASSSRSSSGSGQALADGCKKKATPVPLPPALEMAVERSARAAVLAALEAWEARTAATAVAPAQAAMETPLSRELPDPSQQLSLAHRALAAPLERLGALCPRLEAALGAAQQQQHGASEVAAGPATTSQRPAGRDAHLVEAYHLAREAGGLVEGLQGTLAEMVGSGATARQAPPSSAIIGGASLRLLGGQTPPQQSQSPSSPQPPPPQQQELLLPQPPLSSPVQANTAASRSHQRQQLQQQPQQHGAAVLQPQLQPLPLQPPNASSQPPSQPQSSACVAEDRSVWPSCSAVPGSGTSNGFISSTAPLAATPVISLAQLAAPPSGSAVTPASALFEYDQPLSQQQQLLQQPLQTGMAVATTAPPEPISAGAPPRLRQPFVSGGVGTAGPSLLEAASAAAASAAAGVMELSASFGHACLAVPAAAPRLTAERQALPQPTPAAYGVAAPTARPVGQVHAHGASDGAHAHQRPSFTSLNSILDSAWAGKPVAGEGYRSAAAAAATDAAATDAPPSSAAAASAATGRWVISGGGGVAAFPGPLAGGEGHGRVSEDEVLLSSPPPLSQTSQQSPRSAVSPGRYRPSRPGGVARRAVAAAAARHAAAPSPPPRVLNAWARGAAVRPPDDDVSRWGWLSDEDEAAAQAAAVVELWGTARTHNRRPASHKRLGGTRKAAAAPASPSSQQGGKASRKAAVSRPGVVERVETLRGGGNGTSARHPAPDAVACAPRAVSAGRPGRGGGAAAAAAVAPSARLHGPARTVRLASAAGSAKASHGPNRTMTTTTPTALPGWSNIRTAAAAAFRTESDDSDVDFLPPAAAAAAVAVTTPKRSARRAVNRPSELELFYSSCSSPESRASPWKRRCRRAAATATANTVGVWCDVQAQAQACRMGTGSAAASPKGIVAAAGKVVAAQSAAAADCGVRPGAGAHDVDGGRRSRGGGSGGGSRAGGSGSGGGAGCSGVLRGVGGSPHRQGTSSGGGGGQSLLRSGLPTRNTFATGH